jgi:hypothetical protein
VRIWALGDTHLSFGNPKPMDVFGELWRDHPRRIAEAWDERVAPDDVVLVVGDISWGRTLDEAEPDLAFLADRPGRLKVLLRGNHDSWWSSASKVRRALPSGFEIVSGDALRVAPGVVACGARGWNAPSSPWFDESKDERIYRRELRRLQASLEAAAGLREPADLLVAMLHYPPLWPNETTSDVLERLVAGGVALAAYGHLHGDDHAWAPGGVFDGVDVRFVAADFVGFAPQPLVDVDDGRARIIPPEAASGE